MTSESKIDLKSLRYDDLCGFISSLRAPKYRADQIFAWIARGVTSFSQMTNLPAAFILLLEQKAWLSPFEITNKFVSALDGTVKYLVTLYNGIQVECVVMQYQHGSSICISTQAGCNMGCAFCASTIGGKQRDLTAGEILDQYLFISKDLSTRIDSIVLMGMGEPLDNYDNLLVFLDNVSNKKGVNLSHRHITLSTCGLVDKIYALAELKLGLTLSVSLHAPTDEQRRQIMPIAKKWCINDLLSSCTYYEINTGRRISFEYTLIKDFNDSPEDARKLASLMSRFKNKHVNLINVNPVDGCALKKTSDKRLKAFALVLEKLECNPTVRRSMGSDISGSCGQLRICPTN